MSRRSTTHLFLPLAFVTLLVAACRHEVDGSATDKQLFDEARVDTLVGYVNTPLITAAAGNSPHGSFRVRFNGIAAAALDSTGELPAGNSFPPGSLIVKDVYAGGSVNLFAIMKKAPGDPLAGEGWLWAEITTEGSVIFSAGKKGDGCIGCHSQEPHRDLVRLFDLH